MILGAGGAGAFPIPPTPAPTASSSASPSPSPPPNALPFDSELVFVLDQPISSKGSRTGQLIAAHLKDPIVIDGRVVAPAGSPAKIRIVDTSPADIMDVYGFVDIFFEPLTLPDGRSLPLRAPVARLSPHVTAGHQSTVELEDTVEDQVIPFHWLYHILRKGKNFVLGAGSLVPARTEASLTAMPNGAIAIQTPQPLAASREALRPTFPVEPLATPFGPFAGKKPPSPSPTPWPTPAPPSASPSTPSASPSPTPSA